MKIFRQRDCVNDPDGDGGEPETPFAEGLKKTVRWYASNRSCWRKVRTRSPG
jgi:dTDP-D-glucose 4,6-dehydratase